MDAYSHVAKLCLQIREIFSREIKILTNPQKL